ncbi:MAG: NYN domain-containing protein [Clostridia bacterium]|nr:NYN domain-containing protein [Clostridia bacterium]
MKITLGILAHVDAGKTTLTEAMLYNAGAIKTQGRVDSGDCLLDSHGIERERGITVFSKLARLTYSGIDYTVVDTPGHLDFFSEAERALAIQDYAILVVSADDGAVFHTKTLLSKLKSRRIPTFIFVNKMDMAKERRIDILNSLRATLDKGICDFNLESEDKARFYEECAGVDEQLIGEYLDCGTLSDGSLAEAIRRCTLIPAIFGSALKNTGVDVLLRTVSRFVREKAYSKTLFGAKIYKIMTAPDGMRLTLMKITGGELAVKDTLEIRTDGDSVTEHGNGVTERVEQLRLYSGDKFKTVRSASAGEVVAIPNLKHTRAGMGLGTASCDELSAESVLDYRITFPAGCDIHRAYLDLIPLGDEEPTLALRYDEETKEVRVRLMGEIQSEVLKRLIKDRLSLEVGFEEAGIVYRETVSDTVFGAGHFEPLMHYAEVRLRLEPLERGAGLVFATEVPTDTLKLNWQRLILSHLEERRHMGKLVCAPITDMKITLIAGRAHPKHTEGGDFRQATFRALNQALMKAREAGALMLLEPTFRFEARLPEGALGRFLNDIEMRHGRCDAPEFTGEGEVKLTGYAPVYGMRSYHNELRAYTRGEGRLYLTAGEYLPCHNAEEVIAARAYDPEADIRRNPNSVLCKGGAGYLVPWYEADGKMHTPPPEGIRASYEAQDEMTVTAPPPQGSKGAKDYRATVAEDKELMRIFEATYGRITPRKVSEKTVYSGKERAVKPRQIQKGDEYLLIDGYNFIFANEELSRLASSELSHARDTLIRLLCNYRGVRRARVIIVFDGHKRAGNEGTVEDLDGVTVVYTKQRQTADAYIERAAYSIKAPDTVRVVTDDRDEQLIVIGAGGLRVTTREFMAELDSVALEIAEFITAKK